jgi:hypothetical protein
MTREDLVKWAREAGFMFCEESYKYRPNCLFYGGYAVDEQLERFAAFVEDAQARRMHAEGMVTVGYMRQQVAAERNKVASWMMAQGYATGHGDTVEDLLKELDWQIAENWTRGMVNGVEAEREACAKVCEDKNTLLAWPTYAAAIRARGQDAS